MDRIINLRKKHYVRQQQEGPLKEGDRLALLGRGIGVVKQADEKEAAVVLGNGEVLRIARKDIVLSQRNRQWESATTAQLTFSTYLDG